MEFAAPASGGEGVTAAEVEGHILVVEPTALEEGVVTVHGPKDAIRCTVHDITAQATYTDCLWFGGYLVGGLKGRIGQRVLGMMGKGQAKPGQSAPWVLTDLSSEPKAVEAATAYLTGQVAATVAAPAPAADSQQSALDAALGNLAAAGITK